MENIQYTWADLDRDIKILVEKIKPTSYSLVVGLSRGGLVPGVMISHAISVPFQPLIWTSAHTADWVNQDTFSEILSTAGKILVVDDICDSGNTFQRLFQALDKVSYGITHRVDFASLIYNADQSFKPEYFAQVIRRSETPNYYDFAWEVTK